MNFKCQKVQEHLKEIIGKNTIKLAPIIIKYFLQLPVCRIKANEQKHNSARAVIDRKGL